MAACGMARILVVDDQQIVCELISAFLRDEACGGHDVVSAADKDVALALLRDERFDLISTGINNWASMDGIELARRAREQQPGLKVVFVSADIHSRDRLEPRDWDHFVEKPFTIRQLARALEV
jgi:CheY-like chemotaxis protein